jgi:hypothetical protein
LDGDVPLRPRPNRAILRYEPTSSGLDNPFLLPDRVHAVSPVEMDREGASVLAFVRAEPETGYLDLRVIADGAEGCSIANRAVEATKRA